MAHVKLTDKVIASLKPGKERQYVRDTAVTGFLVVVQPTGKKAYYVEGVVKDGPKFQFKFANADALDADEARLEAVKLLDAAKSGVHPKDAGLLKSVNGKTVTLQAALDDFCKTRINLKASTIRSYRYAITSFCKDWLRLPVSAITPDMVRLWYVEGKDRPTAQDHARRSLSAVLTHCVGNGWIESNPCEVIGKLRLGFKKNVRTDHVDVEDELGPLLLAMKQFKPARNSQRTAIDAWLFMIAHGTRKEETFTMRWENVDFSRRIVTFPDTKNGRDHVLPMADLTWRLLKARWQEKADSQEWVFPNKQGDGPLTDIRKTVALVYEAADVPRRTNHDMRRTFTTIADYVDINENTIKVLVNHKDRSVTQRYIQGKKKALRSLELVHAHMDKAYREERKGRTDRGSFAKDMFSPRMYPGAYGPDGRWLDNYPDEDDIEAPDLPVECL